MQKNLKDNLNQSSVSSRWALRIEVNIELPVFLSRHWNWRLTIHVSIWPRPNSFERKHLLPVSDYPPFTLDDSCGLLSFSAVIWRADDTSSHTTAPSSGSGSAIFMPMSHSHTYSVFMSTSAWRQCLSYQMWHPCSVQLSASLINTVAHHRFENHTGAHYTTLKPPWNAIELTVQKLHPIWFMICCTKSCFTCIKACVTPSLPHANSAEELQWLFLLCDQVIEINLYPLISALHLSIIFLNLKLIR